MTILNQITKTISYNIVQTAVIFVQSTYSRLDTKILLSRVNVQI